METGEGAHWQNVLLDLKVKWCVARKCTWDNQRHAEPELKEAVHRLKQNKYTEVLTEEDLALFCEMFAEDKNLDLDGAEDT